MMDAINTLAIGNSRRIETLYYWLDKSDKLFNMPIIIVEDEEAFENVEGKNYSVVSIKDILNVNIDMKDYELIFICSQYEQELSDMCRQLGADEECIHRDGFVYSFLPPVEMMEYRQNILFQKDQIRYRAENVKVGVFTYGVPQIQIFDIEEEIAIGKFCSIADNVQIFGGGEHRQDWATTFPFNAFFPEYAWIKGHPATKGSVHIGNDVWLGSGAKIMSGVNIGDGAVIGANTLVTRDVPPYAVVAGNPAKVIKYRFDETLIEKFMEMKWWDWKYEHIYKAIPLLQNNQFEELFAFYENTVLSSR